MEDFLTVFDLKFSSFSMPSDVIDMRLSFDGNILYLFANRALIALRAYNISSASDVIELGRTTSHSSVYLTDFFALLTILQLTG